MKKATFSSTRSRNDLFASPAFRPPSDASILAHHIYSCHFVLDGTRAFALFDGAIIYLADYDPMTLAGERIRLRRDSPHIHRSDLPRK